MNYSPWLLLSRISAAVLAVSLAGATIPFFKGVAVYCWLVAGSSVGLLTLAANKLRDVERANAALNGSWLNEGHAPSVEIGGIGDAGGD